MHRDAFVAIALIAFAIAAIVGVWPLELASRGFPVALAGFLIIASLVMLVTSLRDRGVNQDKEDRPPRGRLVGVVAATIALALAVPSLGFYPATFGYLAALYVWLSDLRVMAAVGIATALTAMIYVLFGYFLTVPTPSGVIGSLLQG